MKKNKPRILNIALYCSGLCAGCLPLFWYLLKNKIPKDFIYWVYAFNRQRLVVSVALPVAVACLATWAGFLLFIRWQRSKDTRPLILLAALLLSTASSLTGVASVGGGYYLAIWFILSAAAASGCDINAVLTREHSLIKKSVLAGVLFSLLIAPNFFHARTHKDRYLNEDKRAIARLMKYSTTETCLLLLPLHPVFSHDATRLYSDWQYLFLSQFPDVKLDIKSENTADRIISNRPAVIAYYFDRKWVLLDFMLKGLISKEDFRKLSNFLEENYTTDWIGENKYYIRRDRL